MAKIRVIAGDIDEGDWSVTTWLDTFVISRASTKAHPWRGESIDLKQLLKSAETVNQEQVKKLSGTLGWGFLGHLALGPLGAIGGMLIGGNRTQVLFAAELRDNRRFLASTDFDTWTQLYGIVFEALRQEEQLADLRSQARALAEAHAEALQAHGEEEGEALGTRMGVEIQAMTSSLSPDATLAFLREYDSLFQELTAAQTAAHMANIPDSIKEAARGFAAHATQYPPDDLLHHLDAAIENHGFSSSEEEQFRYAVVVYFGEHIGHPTQ
jgi:hypothetical protein